MCVCSNQVFGTLRPPLPSLGPKHSSECMVQMVFNLFFGLFASLDRLSVPTAEDPLLLQKYEPMWKHSGGKLMGPIPLTQNSTARFSFDFIWFVFFVLFMHLASVFVVQILCCFCGETFM